MSGMGEQSSGKERLCARVLYQGEIAGGIMDMRLHVPEVASVALPGQFVNLFCRDESRLLPRPISIAGVDAGEETIRLVYRVSGAGTKEFASRAAGEEIELIGPLGNGFPLDEAKGKHLILIGGGIGIPPLLCVAAAMAERGEETQSTAVLGYRDDALFLAEEFEPFGRVCIATEDGSAGVRGTVLDALKAMDPGCVAGSKEDRVIFACGPTPMLRAVKEYAALEGVPCYLSLEERMACGVGACLACVCTTAEIDAHSHVHNRRVCKDGPVFPAEEIVL